MGSVVVVEVLPFLEPVVEELGVVDHGSVEHAVELFLVDAVGTFDLAVEAGGGGFDVYVSDAPIEHVVMELGAELGPVVGLDDLDSEWKPSQDVSSRSIRSTKRVLCASWIKYAVRVAPPKPSSDRRYLGSGGET